MKVLGTVLLLSSLAMAQNLKQAPTADQCREDRRQWAAAVDDRSSRHEPITTIEEREVQLLNCAAVDLSYEMAYVDLAMKYSIDEANRLRGFLKRHHLVEQFKEEDEAGKR